MNHSGKVRRVNEELLHKPARRHPAQTVIFLDRTGEGEIVPDQVGQTLKGDAMLPDRTCKSCGEEKPFTVEFFLARGKGLGPTGWNCKKCISTTQYLRFKKRREEDPEFNKRALEMSRERWKRRMEDPEYRRNYYKDRKNPKVREWQRNYVIRKKSNDSEYREKVKENYRDWERRKRAEDPLWDEKKNERYREYYRKYRDRKRRITSG